MSDKEYKLPTRKWYTLEQAAKRINKLTGEEIEIADLLHYWLSRKLEICTFCDFFRELVIGGQKLTSSDVVLFDCEDGDYFKNYYNENLIAYLVNTENLKEEIENKITGNKDSFIIEDFIDDVQSIFIYRWRSRISLNGLLSIIYTSNIVENEKEYLKNGIMRNHFILSTPKDENDCRTYFTLITKNKVSINLDDIYILNNDLEDFINDRANPPEPQKEKAPTTKTLNSQAEFIRNLITIHYGEKVANNIRNELENPRSRITCDFEKNGLKPAVGKTVDGWINQI